MIVGGGVIGCSIAYHIAIDESIQKYVCVIEPCEVAAAASGNAGGFLAKSWCDGDPRQELARASFDMFPGLARAASAAGRNIHYRRVNTRSLATTVGRDFQSARLETKGPRRATMDANSVRDAVLNAFETRAALPWLDGRHAGSSPMCRGDIDTAQVHPRLYTRFLAEAAAAKGVEFWRGQCVGLDVQKVSGSAATKGEIIGIRASAPSSADDSYHDPRPPPSISDPEAVLDGGSIPRRAASECSPKATAPAEGC